MKLPTPQKLHSVISGFRQELQSTDNLPFCTEIEVYRSIKIKSKKYLVTEIPATLWAVPLGFWCPYEPEIFFTSPQATLLFFFYLCAFYASSPKACMDRFLALTLHVYHQLTPIVAVILVVTLISPLFQMMMTLSQATSIREARNMDCLHSLTT